MVIAGIPTDQLLHTRAAQDLPDRGRPEGEARGRQEGEAQGEAKVTLRLLNSICAPLSDAATAEIQACRWSSWSTTVALVGGASSDDA